MDICYNIKQLLLLDLLIFGINITEIEIIALISLYSCVFYEHKLLEIELLTKSMYSFRAFETYWQIAF